MTKKDAINRYNAILLSPIGFFQGIAIICLVISPFLWIWISWTIAWKVGLTGLIGVIVLYWLYVGFKGAIKSFVNKDKDFTA